MKGNEKLVQLMANKAANCNIVTAGFENEVPAQYRVFIIQAGATFNYDDSSSEVVGPRNVNIGSGGRPELFMTQCTDKCCAQIFGAMNVKQEGFPDIVTLTDTRNAAPGHCLLATRFVLVLEQEGTKQQLDDLGRTGNITSLLRLEIR
jgi:hypothetical protein